MGVSQDISEAYKWFALAARSGDKDAEERRRTLMSKLDKQALARVDAVVASWRSRPLSRLANDPFFAGNQWKNKST